MGRRFESVWGHVRLSALVRAGLKCYIKNMKTALLLAALWVIPTAAVPQCVVIHDGICFESQAQYDEYMGWGPEQQKLEQQANN